MGSSLEARLDSLRSAQNADGGWPYFRRKGSWLEPTAWAMLALSREADSAAWGKAWSFMRGLQRDDGDWRPATSVADAHWTTALAVTLHCVRGVYDRAFERGVARLLETAGAEGRWLQRLIHALNPGVIEMDYSLQGWPWRPSNSSWVEPTAHTLVALRKAAAQTKLTKLTERIGIGERMLLDRRCVDGGWNYGNRRVLGENLDSYPETTAVALVGLQKHSADLEPSIRLALRYRNETRSRLARVWLTIALRLHGQDPSPTADPEPSQDVLITALEALGDPDGSHGVLRM